MARLPHNAITKSKRKFAKTLRRRMTEEEALLWVELKNFRKFDLAFRRQAPVGPYIADFLCRKAKVIVEVDGWHHDLPDQMEKDERRDQWLAENDYTVLRYAARDIWDDLDGVIMGIGAAVGFDPLA